MERKDVLTSAGYWTAEIQLDLYECAERFMQKRGMNRKQLAEHLGVSKGYVSQLLNGDYNHRISKMVELALAFGYAPCIDFKPLEDVIAKDAKMRWGNTISIDYSDYMQTIKHFDNYDAA